MKKAFAPPLAALLAGGAGYFLRRRELASAFESSGLPIPGAPITILLACLSAAFLVAAALLSWRLCRGRPPQNYDQAFTCPSPVFITANVVAALLLLGGGALGVLGYVNRTSPQLSPFLVAVLALAAGYCVLMSGRRNYRSDSSGRYSGLVLVPAFTLCVWLVSVYQSRAGDPIILDYVYQILAIITTLLSLYFMAGYSFEKGRPALCLWAFSAAIYFSCLTLADGHTGMTLCLHAFAIVYCVQYSAVLVANLTAEREVSSNEQE